ncbi:unnamed protein product [marine sediment metagenome]|uniref:Uncharacterized protein n=1 Tax=marine sediment metagenome TaxID=412755 RepID=X0YR36_9ZZZZ
MYNFDKDKMKIIAYRKGYNVSQKFKHNPAWDNIAEPFIIRQFAFITEVSNSFIKGLISDNNSTEKLDETKEFESVKQKKD